MRSCNWYCRKELVLEVEGSMNPVIFGSSHDQSGQRFRKKCALDLGSCCSVVGCSRGIKGFCWG